MSIIRDWQISLACFRSILKRRPIFAAWLITHRCNLQCKFCNYWKRDINILEELTVEEFARASGKLIQLGIRVVNLAGGEPFVRNDLSDIIAQLSPDHIVIINTNGTLVTRENAKAIFEAGTDIVNVSLDFFSKEKNDYYRGPGTYEKAVQALEILQESRTRKRQKVAIQTIMNPGNLEEFEKLVQFAEDRDIDFTFNPYRPGNHAVDLSIQQPLDIKILYDFKKKYRRFKATDFALKKTSEYLKQRYIPGCGAAKYMLAIDPYGEVVPCEDRIHISAGNIKDLSLQEAVVNLEKLHRENTCNKCWARERSEIEILYEERGWKWFKNLLDVRK